MDLTTTFPPDIPFLNLLREFQAWAKPYSFGGLGYFEFSAQGIDDNWIENGSAISDQFAFFLQLPDGSNIGFWRHETASGQTHYPVVLLGGEGAQKILAADLPSFLWKWADGKLADLDVFDLEPDPDEVEAGELEDARPALAEWLKQQGVEASRSIRRPTSALLQRFLSGWQQQQLEQWKQNKPLQRLGAMLQAHAHAKLPDWQAVDLRVEATRDGLQLTKSPLTQPEQAEALTLLKQLREDMDREKSERGPWRSAWIQWYKTLGVSIRAKYGEPINKSNEE